MGYAATPSFPRLDADFMRARLAPPEGPVRLLIDTDAANEIDDQFALAWALMSQDRLRIEAVTAAPFSFEFHREGLLAAEAQLDARGPRRHDRRAARGRVPGMGGAASPAGTACGGPGIPRYRRREWS